MFYETFGIRGQMETLKHYGICRNYTQKDKNNKKNE